MEFHDRGRRENLIKKLLDKINSKLGKTLDKIDDANNIKNEFATKSIEVAAIEAKRYQQDKIEFWGDVDDRKS